MGWPIRTPDLPYSVGVLRWRAPAPCQHESCSMHSAYRLSQVCRPNTDDLQVAHSARVHGAPRAPHAELDRSLRSLCIHEPIRVFGSFVPQCFWLSYLLLFSFACCAPGRTWTRLIPLPRLHRHAPLRCNAWRLAWTDARFPAAAATNGCRGLQPVRAMALLLRRQKQSRGRRAEGVAEARASLCGFVGI